MVARTCRGAFIFNIMNALRKLINIFKKDPYERLKLSVISLCGLPQNLIAFFCFMSGGDVSFLLGTLPGDFTVFICYVYYVIVWIPDEDDF